MTRAVALLLLVACATAEPPAPYGTAAWAQQNYKQAVDECQQIHSRHMSTLASTGHPVSEDDASFNACMQEATEGLDRSLQLVH